MDNIPNSIFEIMDEGDRAISKIKENCIMMVGLTRQGKSTSYNWILGKSMRGAINGGITIYELTGEDEAALIAPGLVSVTMVPNIYAISDNVSLADMAGFKDKRLYGPVIGVSYLLKATFEQAKNYKFLIVLDEDAINSQTSSDFVSTLTYFCKMFDIKSMMKDDKEQKEKDKNAKTVLSKFLNSVALLVTKSQKKASLIVQILEGKLHQLKNPSMSNPLKAQMTVLLEHIIEENRIKYFKQAKEQKSPEPCTIIHELDEKKYWSWFNIKESKEALKTDIILLPFAQDFKVLQASEQNKFKTAMKDRSDSYKEIGVIMKDFIDQGRAGWFYHDKDPDYNAQNAKMAAFLVKYDKNYNTEHKINLNELNPHPKVATKLKLANQILALNVIINSIQPYGKNQKPAQFLEYLEPIFKNVLSKFSNIFLKSVEQQKVFARVAYMTFRGFRQFSALNEICPDKVGDSALKIKATFDQMFDKSHQSLIQQFLLGLTLPLKKKLLVTQEQLEKFEWLLQEYQAKYKLTLDPITFSIHKIQTGSILGENFFAKQEWKKALECFVPCFNKMAQYGRDYEASKKSQGVSEQKIEDQLKKNAMKLTSTLYKIKECLIKLHDYNVIALDVCQYLQCVHSTCEVYQLILKDCKLEHSQKMNFIVGYAEYCTNYGRPQQALMIYQRALSMETQNFDNRIRILNKLFQLTETCSKHEQYKPYRKNLGETVMISGLQARWTRIDKQISKKILKLKKASSKS